MAEDGTHPALDKDYQMILDRLTAASKEEARTNPHFSSVAIIALADYYSRKGLFLVYERCRQMAAFLC